MSDQTPTPALLEVMDDGYGTTHSTVLYHGTSDIISDLPAGAYWIVPADEPLYRIDTPLNEQIEMIAELKWAGVLVQVTP